MVQCEPLKPWKPWKPLCARIGGQIIRYQTAVMTPDRRPYNFTFLSRELKLAKSGGLSVAGSYTGLVFGPGLPCGVSMILVGLLTIPYHTIPYHTIPYHTIPYACSPRRGGGHNLV